jgi:tetratricopeptide (TPR) repeat protein
MKKTSSFLALSLMIGLVSAAAAQRRAHLHLSAALLAAGPTLYASPAPAAQGSVWKSQDEYNAYMAMHNEKDNQKKVALAEAFLAKYADAVPAVRGYVYAEMLQTLQQIGDSTKAIATAKDLLKIDPNNLEGLRYLSFTFPFIFKPTDADAADQLSQAETNAKHGLDLLGKVPKPANMSDEQFQQAIKPVRATFNSTIGFVALQRKDYAGAVTALKSALEDNPNDLYASNWLGTAYLYSSPPDYSNGVWYLARADALAKSSKGADESQINKYLSERYACYHGSGDGLDAVKNQAASSATPPADFQVAALQAPAPTGNPNVDNFNKLTYRLKVQGCPEIPQQIWPQLKGQPLGLGGYVNSVDKGTDPDTFLVKISLDQSKADSSFDIVLQDSQPKVDDLAQGDPVRFQGTIDSYTATPTFSLTLTGGKINQDDIDAATAKAKTRPRRKK